MAILTKILLFQVFLCSLALIMAQWCIEYKAITKTRIQTKRNFHIVTAKILRKIVSKNVTFTYTTIETYTDYKRIDVCCSGYKQTNATQCEPICTPLCPQNTNCIKPNMCECTTGYSGYHANPKTIKCQPICQTACQQNAKCTAPNTCECIEGYKEDAKGDCQPVCSKSCPMFSNCTYPEKCLCQELYEMKDGKCWPICKTKCPQKSQCVKPNKCACNKGYESKVNEMQDLQECQAICGLECKTLRLYEETKIFIISYWWLVIIVVILLALPAVIRMVFSLRTRYKRSDFLIVEYQKEEKKRNEQSTLS